MRDTQGCIPGEGGGVLTETGQAKVLGAGGSAGWAFSAEQRNQPAVQDGTGQAVWGVCVLRQRVLGQGQQQAVTKERQWPGKFGSQL